jgi:glucose/arabinose dehydrogenase
LPEISAAGQGGLGDIITHPDFENNQRVYLSYIASDDGGDSRYAAVISARLEREPTPKLVDHKMIWRQYPALSGAGHFSHRLVFGPDQSDFSRQLFITSGDRQRLTPAQGFDQSLGKIIRVDENGNPPDDNPFQDKGALAKYFWTMGHRNLLGIAFDENGQLWSHEMGPRDGDELNLIIKGGNYGWPLVSEGDHYNGTLIPSHDTRPDFISPELFWVPTIAPSGLIFYGGDLFPEWRGNAFIGGLRSRALIRVAFVDGHPVEAERFRWSVRLREVEEGPNGELYVLEDGASGRLIRLIRVTP